MLHHFLKINWARKPAVTSASVSISGGLEIFQANRVLNSAVFLTSSASIMTISVYH